MAAKRLNHELARSLWDDGLPADEIAAIIGSTANGVHSLANYKRWPRRTAGPSRRRRDEQWAETERLWREGVPAKQIAQRLGYKYASSVRHLAQRMGWPRRNGNRDTAKATAAVLRHYRSVADKQVARCDRYLALEPAPDAQCWRRCPTCGGREAPDQPHAHGSAA